MTMKSAFRLNQRLQGFRDISVAGWGDCLRPSTSVGFVSRVVLWPSCKGFARGRPRLLPSPLAGAQRGVLSRNTGHTCTVQRVAA
jgi:hypothetical protein